MSGHASTITIRLMLVDDHAVVRNGYRRLFDAEPDLLVVAEAARADEANALLATCQPDVAVVDLSLRGSSGFEAIRGLLARAAHLKVLVLSMHEEPGHITQALRCGALGYLSKHCEPQQVIDAIRTVAAGARAFSPEIAQIIACQAAAGAGAFDQLSPREFEVLRMLVRGDSSQAIARSMQLSPKTILNNLSLIRQKLGVDNDFKLLHLAARHGLVSVGPQA